MMATLHNDGTVSAKSGVNLGAQASWVRYPDSWHGAVNEFSCEFDYRKDLVRWFDDVIKMEFEADRLSIGVL